MNIVPFLLDHTIINDLIKKDKVRIGGTCDEFNIMMLACDFYLGDSSIFVVLPNLYTAQKYYDQLLGFISDEYVLFFPADELVSAEMIAATGDFLFERIQTINSLLQGEKRIIVTNMHGLIKYEMPKKVWEYSTFSLRKGTCIEIKDLLDKLVRIGYEPVYTITKTGEFSRRGSIVDIFPLGYDKPIRLDFFGDEIETIKYFNMETQRSIEQIISINILPVTEFIYDDIEFKEAKRKIYNFIDQYKLSPIEEEMINKDMFSLENHQNLLGLSRYFEFFNNEISTILDFVDNKKVYMIDPIKSKEGYDHLLLDLNEYCGRMGGYVISNMKLFENFEHSFNKGNVYIEGLRTLGNLDYKLAIKEGTYYKGNQKEIINDFKRYRDNKYIILSYTNEDRLNKLLDICLDEGLFLVKVKDCKDIKMGQINCVHTDLPAFNIIKDDVMFLNDNSLYQVEYQPRKTKYKSIYKNAVKISKYDELEVGDYVVHYDHGIGKYLGMKTMEHGGIKRDFLFVMYGKGSNLYIPLEQLSSIMKYASKDVEGILLHEIGGTAWARTKAKVRSKVKDISEQLIKLYAARQNAEGFGFGPDTVEQEMFENDFEYELTLDQKRAIDSVKIDMEDSRPMDRLICGDVGYGKTEVAMRAAFKAVYGGKQVAMLAPTKILSTQHYKNFKKRMEYYGITVELLNGFVSAKKQDEVIEGIKKGVVDVVIGTHRILNNEVQFKDLGLLIVDEEQKFGVTHKEKIKSLKVNVDCITLSATPIPRTLQMSMLGLKDLSMIETPPKNRFPVQTYVLERNDRIIVDAIEREMARGGQVFYLYNFVETIEDVAAHIQSLVPHARLCVGHGRLSKDQLDKKIQDFIDFKYDVLICTTIIETGIDMPNTNTLIIHDADRLGLSQLYQIRGRVGRSNKIAYAYLMYEPRKLLTPEAEKRLETIKEFNELGSGYKIAMRDLSIRGSGDLLGSEQSGFVESVGLDMYLKILNEEINHVVEVKEQLDRSITTPLVNRTIDKNYIDNDDVRIAMHRKIDKLNSLEALKELEAEMIDRFGEINEELYLYMYEKLMKNFCKIIGIEKMNTNNYYMEFIYSIEASKAADGNLLFSECSSFNDIKLSYKDGKIYIIMSVGRKEKLECFKQICNYFNRIK